MADKEKKKKKCGGEGEGNDYNFLCWALNIVDIVLYVWLVWSEPSWFHYEFLYLHFCGLFCFPYQTKDHW